MPFVCKENHHAIRLRDAVSPKFFGTSNGPIDMERRRYLSKRARRPAIDKERARRIRFTHTTFSRGRIILQNPRVTHLIKDTTLSGLAATAISNPWLSSPRGDCRVRTSAVAATQWELTNSVLCGAGKFTPVVNEMMEVTGHYANIEDTNSSVPQGSALPSPPRSASRTRFHFTSGLREFTDDDNNSVSNLPAPEGWESFAKDLDQAEESMSWFCRTVKLSAQRVNAFKATTVLLIR